MTELKARIQKFLRKADQINSHGHFKKIMESFPRKERPAIRKLVKPKLKPEVRKPPK